MDSKMKMVKGKDGKMVPSFANDGVGKMATGGMMKSKMMKSGGVAADPSGMMKSKAGSKMMKNSAMKTMKKARG